MSPRPAILALVMMAPLAIIPATMTHADLGIEFMVPVLADEDEQQDALQVQQPEEVRSSRPDGFVHDVTVARTPQDAINSVAQRLRNEGDDGASWIEINGQMAVVSSGSGSWDTSIANPNLQLIEQRLAWMQAAMGAKSAMARFIQGASVASKERINEELSTRDTDTLSRINSRRELQEDITSSTSAFLRGAMLYELVEDTEAGSVSVTLVSTPGSQQLLQVRGSGVSGARDLKQGLQALTAEIRAGVVPPTGGRFLENPSTGAWTWVAFGAEPVDPTRTGRVRQLAVENAQRTARLRAERAMLALLRGESLVEEDVLDARYQEILSQTDDLLTRTSDLDVEKLSDQATSSTRSAVASGQLPAGLRSFKMQGAAGIWQYCVLTYEPQSWQTPTDPTQSAPQQVPDQQKPDADVFKVSSDSEGIQILAAGTGATREAAIKSALLEAISMVNGALVEGQTETRQIYETAIKEFEGRLGRNVSSQSISSESIETTSNGLVTRYRILDEGELPPEAPERAAGDNFQVSIQAEVAVFDPDNPRPTGRPTIAVLPMQIVSFMQPPDRNPMTPSEVRTYLTDNITRDLVRRNEFKVLDERYVQELEAQRKQIMDQVREGNADMREVLKLGQELTADYLIMGTVESLNNQKWRRLVKIRDSYETREMLNVNIQMQLVNVSTGEIVWTDHYRNSWDTIELASRDKEDRALPSVIFGMNVASEAIQNSLQDYLDSRKKE